LNKAKRISHIFQRRSRVVEIYCTTLPVVTMANYSNSVILQSAMFVSQEMRYQVFKELNPDCVYGTNPSRSSKSCSQVLQCSKAVGWICQFVLVLFIYSRSLIWSIPNFGTNSPGGNNSSHYYTQFHANHFRPINPDCCALLCCLLYSDVVLLTHSNPIVISPFTLAYKSTYWRKNVTTSIQS
jgi:hypothetical protein